MFLYLGLDPLVQMWCISDKPSAEDPNINQYHLKRTLDFNEFMQEAKGMKHEFAVSEQETKSKKQTEEQIDNHLLSGTYEVNLDEYLLNKDEKGNMSIGLY